MAPLFIAGAFCKRRFPSGIVVVFCLLRRLSAGPPSDKLENGGLGVLSSYSFVGF